MPDAGLDGLMQIPGYLDAGPDALMQVLRCSGAGPWMLGCMSGDGVIPVLRSSDGAVQVPRCGNFRDGNAVGEGRSYFGKSECY